jgi:hypothetical protein
MIPNLPSTNDDYWDGYTNSVHIIDNRVCDHKLAYRSAREVQCIKCNAGWFIGLDDVIRDGKLFHSNKQVI